MTEALPRQTYRTDMDGESEERIADLFATWCKAKQLKIGKDDPDRQKPRIDRVLFRQSVVAFFEIKTCSRTWVGSDSWCVGRAKLVNARMLAAIVRVPVLFVVEFGDRALGFIDSKELYVPVENFGRDDRGDPADREPGARFSLKQFRRVQ